MVVGIVFGGKLTICQLPGNAFDCVTQKLLHALLISQRPPMGKIFCSFLPKQEGIGEPLTQNTLRNLSLSFQETPHLRNPSWELLFPFLLLFTLTRFANKGFLSVTDSWLRKSLPIFASYKVHTSLNKSC